MEDTCGSNEYLKPKSLTTNQQASGAYQSTISRWLQVIIFMTDNLGSLMIESTVRNGGS
jgi:hypothetical protein